MSDERMPEAGSQAGSEAMNEDPSLMETGVLFVEGEPLRRDEHGFEPTVELARGPIQYVGFDPTYSSAGEIPDLLISQPPPPLRHPNFGDAALFVALLVMGLLGTTGLLGLAVYFHWFGHWKGMSSFDSASKSTPIALLTQVLLYAVAFGGAVPLFRMLWGTSYFSGLHWHAATAYRWRYWLVGVAVACNLMALIVNLVVKFPDHAPIDKMFSTTADAWMLAIFGVTIAPFFEEMIFRGFFLPAVATAWDWCGERMTGRQPRGLDASGNPLWSAGGMIFSALVVSAPFAFMHSAQVGQAWGPILLLYVVSLALCAVRLATRSLAASTLVHATYNFLLFALMFSQTDGFRHLDKM